jgi:hypothetical protein
VDQQVSPFRKFADALQWLDANETLGYTKAMLGRNTGMELFIAEGTRMWTGTWFETYFIELLI